MIKRYSTWHLPSFQLPASPSPCIQGTLPDHARYLQRRAASPLCCRFLQLSLVRCGCSRSTHICAPATPSILQPSHPVSTPNQVLDCGLQGPEACREIVQHRDDGVQLVLGADAHGADRRHRLPRPSSVCSSLATPLPVLPALSARQPTCTQHSLPVAIILHQNNKNKTT